MNRGDKASYEGYQVSLFPVELCNCTQLWGAGTLSHQVGYCTDWGMPSGYPVYAPFDCHLIWQIGEANGNTRIYTSDKEVWTPKGLKYVTVSFTHDNNPPTKTSYKQGEVIYHSGTAGQVTGAHLHLDASPVANDYLTDPHLAGQSWYLSKDRPPTEIFYLVGDENIVNMRGLEFETWKVSPVSHKGFKWWYAKLLLERRRGNG